MTTNQTERRFVKTVDIVTKDDEEQTATGAVLVPDEVDLQLDFLRPAAIERLHNSAASDGVMHAVEGADVETDHRLLSEAETVGDRELAAGTWLATRHYADPEHWALVRDGVLNGFSIGGRVTEQVEHPPGEVPEDVTFAEGVDAGEGAVEIVDGEIDEVSDVDHPAVPAATFAAVKSELGKNVLEQVDGEAEFVDLMTERGHDAEDARRLWALLESREPLGKPDHPDKPDDEDDDDEDDDEKADTDLYAVDDRTLGARLKRLLFGAEASEADDGPSNSPEDSDPADATEKVGRTLSQVNVDHAKAVHDHAELMLAAEGVGRHTGTSRTYNSDPFDPFDLSAAESAVPKSKGDTDTDTEDGPADEDQDDREPSNTSDMKHDDEDAPEWAQSLKTDVEQLTERVADIEGEPAEKNEDDDPPEWAEDLKADVEALTERVDKVSKATAGSQQLNGRDEEEAKTSMRDAIELEREVFGR